MGRASGPSVRVGAATTPWSCSRPISESVVLRLKPGACPDSGQADLKLNLVNVSGRVILSGSAETRVLPNAG